MTTRNQLKITIVLFLALLAGVFLFLKYESAIWAWIPVEEEEKEEADLLGKIMGRFAQEFEMTVDPATGQVPRYRLIDAYRVAQRRRAGLSQQRGAIPIFWEERGPSNVGGRTRALLIDANDPTGRTVWAGGVAGGLWRTNNIDAVPPVWTPINDFFSTMAITTIAQDPSNPNILYFGTGENGFGNADAVLGMGIWRSTDGGNNWNQLAATVGPNFQDVNKIMVTNAGWVYAASTRGLFLSTDVTTGVWTKVLGLGAGAGGDAVQDFEIAADGTVYAGVNGDGVYRLDPTGWTPLTTNLPGSGFARVELAVAPGNANVLYAAFESSANSNCLSVFQSTNAGNNWTAGTCPMNLGPFCWYAFVMAVDPTNSNRVWIGDVNLFVSGDGGTNWTQIPGIHADHHALVYRPGSATDMVLGNDGGVYRTTNANAAIPAVTAKNNGYNVTQFYANALHPDSGVDYILGGTQDNGTQRFQCAGLCATDMPTGADGAFCFIDDDNPSIQITASQNRVFNLSTNAGASFNNLVGSNNNAPFITPAGYDDAANVLYFSDGPDTLGRMVDVGGGNTMTRDDLSAVLNNRSISTFAISPNTADRIFIGTFGGRIIQIDNADQAGATTPTLLNSPFAQPVSSIAVENGDDLHLLATAANYGITSIFESTDGGMNWTQVEGDLPDLPVRWIMFHPFDEDQALIATELGVWTTDDLDGANTAWFPSNTFGLANVRVDMLQYRPSDHLVAAATHGRGMYSTDYFGLLDSCVNNLVINGAVASGLYMAEDFITSGGTVPVGGKVVYQAGNRIELQAGFWARSGSDFLAAIADCGVGTSSSFAEAPGPVPPGALAPTRVQEGPLSLRCFPNPTDFKLTIDLELPAEGWYSVYVRSMTGQLIATLADRQRAGAGKRRLELNAQAYEAGMYVLVLQTAEGAVAERFVVAK